MDRRAALGMIAGAMVSGWTASRRAYAAEPLQIKLVVVGDHAVGKTCAVIRYTTHAFPGEYVPQVFDNYTVAATLGGQPCSVAVWDTDGREVADRSRPLSYPQADGVLIFYAVNDPASFTRAKTKWYPEIRHHLPAVPVVLVGHKTDLRGDAGGAGMITTAQGQALATELAASAFHECSAKGDVGISQAFEGTAAAAIAARRLGAKRQLRRAR